ncbi:hypothetical protein B0H13DRAFT_2295823 [Mycena leptocephala]|nr:hypothetical protein B0H13DRAFT_2295823 [Mycena leptocephala]
MWPSSASHLLSSRWLSAAAFLASAHHDSSPFNLIPLSNAVIYPASAVLYTSIFLLRGRPLSSERHRAGAHSSGIFHRPLISQAHSPAFSPLRDAAFAVPHTVIWVLRYTKSCQTDGGNWPKHRSAHLSGRPELHKMADTARRGPNIDGVISASFGVHRPASTPSMVGGDLPTPKAQIDDALERLSFYSRPRCTAPDRIQFTQMGLANLCDYQHCLLSSGCTVAAGAYKSRLYDLGVAKFITRYDYDMTILAFPPVSRFPPGTQFFGPLRVEQTWSAAFPHVDADGERSPHENWETSPSRQIPRCPGLLEQLYRSSAELDTTRLTKATTPLHPVAPTFPTSGSARGLIAKCARLRDILDGYTSILVAEIGVDGTVREATGIATTMRTLAGSENQLKYGPSI